MNIDAMYPTCGLVPSFGVLRHAAHVLLARPGGTTGIDRRNPRVRDEPIVAPRFCEVAERVIAVFADGPVPGAVGLEYEALPPAGIVDIVQLAVVRSRNGAYRCFDGLPIEAGQHTNRRGGRARRTPA